MKRTKQQHSFDAVDPLISLDIREEQFPETMTQTIILRQYDSLEELCEALESCFDLYDLGYVDKSTQYNYLALYEMKGTDLYLLWKGAKRLSPAESTLRI